MRQRRTAAIEYLLFKEAGKRKRQDREQTLMNEERQRYTQWSVSSIKGTLPTEIESENAFVSRVRERMRRVNKAKKRDKGEAEEGEKDDDDDADLFFSDGDESNDDVEWSLQV